MDNSIKDALKPNLTRPLDKAAMSNDSATLRALTGMLNNPALTGAVVPKGETTALPTTALPPGSIPDHSDVSPPSNIGGAAPFPSAQTANPPGSALPPAREVPAKETPAAAVKVGLRLLFTGRGLSDTAHAIGAVEYNISAPVFKLAQKFFNESVFSDVNSISAPGSVSFLATIKAWGAGEISAAFPVTPARAIFVQMIRSLAGMADALPAGPNDSVPTKDSGLTPAFTRRTKTMIHPDGAWSSPVSQANSNTTTSARKATLIGTSWPAPAWAAMWTYSRARSITM